MKQFTLNRDSPDAGSTAAIMLSMTPRDKPCGPEVNKVRDALPRDIQAMTSGFGRRRSSDGISPKQAADEAIARIKQILSE